MYRDPQIRIRLAMAVPTVYDTFSLIFYLR